MSLQDDLNHVESLLGEVNGVLQVVKTSMIQPPVNSTEKRWQYTRTQAETAETIITMLRNYQPYNAHFDNMEIQIRERFGI